MGDVELATGCHRDVISCTNKNKDLYKQAAVRAGIGLYKWAAIWAGTCLHIRAGVQPTDEPWHIAGNPA